MRKIIATAVAGLCAFALPSESRSTMLASWYGPGFHGRTTANGERYDMHGLTAAHKTLPFGTRLVFAINDAQPYVSMIVALSLAARELDLSYGAAQAVGLIAPGVANVEVSYL